MPPLTKQSKVEERRQKRLRENEMFRTIRLLDESEVSELLGISKATLAYHRMVGVGLPWVPLEGAGTMPRVRYRYTDIVDYIERQRVVPSVAKNLEAVFVDQEAR